MKQWETLKRTDNRHLRREFTVDAHNKIAVSLNPMELTCHYSMRQVGLKHTDEKDDAGERHN